MIHVDAVALNDVLGKLEMAKFENQVLMLFCNIQWPNTTKNQHDILSEFSHRSPSIIFLHTKNQIVYVVSHKSPFTC